MAGLTLDAAPLIALDRGDRRGTALLRLLLDAELDVTVSAATVAEVWRGGPHGARVARLLAAAQVEPVTERLATRSGELLAVARSSQTLDAIVVATAEARGHRVVTSDVDDVAPLAAVAGVEVRAF